MVYEKNCSIRSEGVRENIQYQIWGCEKKTCNTGPECVVAIVPTRSWCAADCGYFVRCWGQQVADLIGADPKEIIFTSGATESNNIAVKGVARFYKSKTKHVITTQTVSLPASVCGGVCVCVCVHVRACVCVWGGYMCVCVCKHLECMHVWCMHLA